MGLRNWMHNHRMDDPVPGTYELTSCSYPSADAAYSNCRMTGVVSAPAVGPVAVEHTCTAPTRKWPQPGDTLPVVVDRADPTRLRIDWDSLPSIRDRSWQDAREHAQQEAQRLAGTPGGQQPGQYGGQPGQYGGEQPGWYPGQPVAQAGGQSAGAVAGAGFDQATANAVGQAVAAALAGQQPGSVTSPQINITIDYGAGGNTLTAAEAAQLVSTGEPATAVVTAITDVEVPAAFLPSAAASMADLALRVTRSDGRSYPAGTRLGFRSPERRALIGRVGQTVPVRIDPANPARVTIDVPRFDATHGTAG